MDTMKTIVAILFISLCATLVVAQSAGTADSDKGQEIVRDEATGAMTIGGGSSETQTPPPRTEIRETERKSRFDLGGFLQELFDDSDDSPRSNVRSRDYSPPPSQTSPQQTTPPKKTERRVAPPPSATESKPRSDEFDTFIDKNNNGIDDRLEGAKTVPPSRKK